MVFDIAQGSENYRLMMVACDFRQRHAGFDQPIQDWRLVVFLPAKKIGTANQSVRCVLRREMACANGRTIQNS